MLSVLKKETPPPRPIALLTDFGLADPYVGQMKGVLARKVPRGLVVDISHDVAPFNVAQAGFFLAASHAYFPKDAIILAVVDPGVGTKRRIVGLEVDGQLLIAPDNGLLSLVLQKERSTSVRAFDLSAAIDAPQKVSRTFHGRDVFAPLAAWLALGGRPEGVGREIDPAELVSQPWSQPDIQTNRARGHVLHIDRFGNCVLNFEAGTLAKGDNLKMLSPSGGILARVTAYGEMAEGEAGLLEGSQGYLEIAVNLGSAAERFGVSMGTVIELAWEV